LASVNTTGEIFKKDSGNEYLDPDNEDEDEILNNTGQIRIKINKNKQILNHLAKFTKDIGTAIGGKKDGMTLLYYDFNGSKSSLSSRTGCVN
jgi:hypothetical protein